MKISIKTVISLMMRVMSLYKKLVSPVTMMKVTQKNDEILLPCNSRAGSNVQHI